MRRTAWGKTTYQRRCQGRRPIAFAASVWPAGIEIDGAPDGLRHVSAAERRERHHPAEERRDLETDEGEAVETREDQHQHRDAAQHVDVGADQEAQRQRAVFQAHPAERADGRADHDHDQRQFDRVHEPVEQRVARHPGVLPEAAGCAQRSLPRVGTGRQAPPVAARPELVEEFRLPGSPPPPSGRAPPANGPGDHTPVPFEQEGPGRNANRTLTLLALTLSPDGPCDRGNLRPITGAADGLPGSHGSSSMDNLGVRR